MGHSIEMQIGPKFAKVCQSFFCKLPTVLIHQTFLLPTFFTIMVYVTIESVVLNLCICMNLTKVMISHVKTPLL